MSAKWHLKTDGTPGLCTAASLEACPLGGAHFTNREEASYMSELVLKSEIGLFPNFSRGGDVPAKRFLDVLADRTPLKDMNSERLMFALLADAPSGQKLELAVQLASFLHEGQLRGNRAGMPKTPYIEHPLRCALRLKRLGVTDGATLNSAVLHDTVEDTAKKFAKLYTGEDDVPESRARELLLDFIGKSFDTDVQETVFLVTNPLDNGLPETASIEEKHESYRAHVRPAFAAGVRPFLTKTGDVVDNATGLKHSTGLGPVRQGRMARKYEPLTHDIDYWADFYRDELPSDGAREQIHTWMEDTRRSLDVIIKASA